LVDNRGDSALIWAAELGMTEIGCFLLEAGSNVNLKNHNGRTALMMSVRQIFMQDHPAVVRMLIEGGANLDD
jgi:ankyrin repeat protein